VRPTWRSMALCCLLFVPAAIWPGIEAWSLSGALLMVAFGVDYFVCQRAAPLQVTRAVAPNLSVNREHEVLLNISNQSKRSLRASVVDEVPDYCSVRGFPARLILDPAQVGKVRYVLTPTRRGDRVFGRVRCLVSSPLGLWQLNQSYLAPQSVRVYPDFSAIASYLELLSDRQTVRVGIKKSQRRGEGLEFHQLREYRSGDTLRQIDWNATSRRQELVSREYAEERDQRVLFLIDSGRRMRTHDELLSHFDHALNGMSLLAYVALRQGDSVGLKLFGADRRWVPPQRGVGSINMLLNETYTVHSGAEQADYVTAVEELMGHERKRALVILMTNLRDEDSDLLPALRLLRQRHVVILANLRERVLDETLQARPKLFADALRLTSTHDYLEERRRHQARCMNVANAVLDCTPAELPTQVVNAYWQIKSSGKL
jgi:uncharacterized protein (DUF58 family)